MGICFTFWIILVIFHISISIEHGHLSLIYRSKLGYFPVREVFVYRGFDGGWLASASPYGESDAEPTWLQPGGTTHSFSQSWDDGKGGSQEADSPGTQALLGVFLWLVGGDWNHGI
jgi:hypothetical protein